MIQPTILVKYVPKLEGFGHWNGGISSHLEFVSICKLNFRQTVVLHWYSDLEASWSQKSRTSNKRNFKHIITASIHSWKSRTHRHVCESGIHLARLESVIIQDGMRSTGQRNCTSDDQIDNLGPASTLHSTASDTEFDRKLAEAEAAAQSEGKTGTDDDEVEERTGKIRISMSSFKQRSLRLAYWLEPKYSR